MINMVVVCGSGEKFHEAYLSRTEKWRTMCGTGHNTETAMLFEDAVNGGWKPCLRCYPEEES